MRHILSVTLVILLMACETQPKNTAQEPPTHEEILNIYNRYLSGDYAGYVDQMLSCDSMPIAYRQQMIDLHKQHAERLKSNKRQAIGVTVERTELAESGKQVNVFLRVVYANRTHEIIMISMVKHNDRWWLR